MELSIFFSELYSIDASKHLLYDTISKVIGINYLQNELEKQKGHVFKLEMKLEVESWR